jgi:thiamine biosynthesis lipoprotein
VTLKSRRAVKFLPFRPCGPCLKILPRYVPLICSAFLISCTAKVPEPLTVFALGTVCRVNLYGEGTEEIYGELTDRLSAIEDALSVRIYTSEVSLINRNAGAGPVAVSADVMYVIKMAKYFAEKSNGAFDPAIGVLTSLWNIGSDEERVPTAEEIAAALPLVDWRKIALDEDAGTVFLEEPGMKIDLGGIAKGFAADELVKILRRHGAPRAVIDLGGNIYMLGKKKDGSPWRVGVKDPAQPQGDVAVTLELGENSVVTSGMYERFFEEEGERYHHILDPKTGFPASSGVLSATIVCRSSLAADALSTAVFILGRDAGLALLEGGFPEAGVQAEGLVIESGFTVTATEALESALTVQGKNYTRVSS